MCMRHVLDAVSAHRSACLHEPHTLCSLCSTVCRWWPGVRLLGLRLGYAVQ